MPQARCLIPPSVSVCLAVLCLAMLWSPTGVLGAGRVIGVASSMTTIFPEAPPAASDLASEITLFAARGESESAQVVIIAGDADLDIQSVQVSDLRRVAARIAKGNIEVRLVGYANLTQNSWRGIKRLGLWPDPLLAFRPFTCPAGEDRLLWVTVKVPATTPPGVYTGKIKLYSATSLAASLPIRVTVWHFTLPEMPNFATSYWSHTEASYDFSVEPEAFIRTIRLFGEYRVSTDLWPSWNFEDPKNMRDWVVLWYVEPDGTITCDISGMQHTINAARQGGGFGTFQIGHGCWMGDEFNYMPLMDRQTGLLLTGTSRQAALDRVAATLPPHQLVGFPGTHFARTFLPQMCDWLQSQGLLARSYMQLYDESPDPANFPSIASLYQQFRQVEPRMKLLGLTTIHPSMQGVYDIWSPHLAFHDSSIYDMVRNGISLYGTKNFPAAVTASSSGRPTYLYYQPIDGYDGLDYTKWAPGAAPTADTPQWIRFDFNDPSGGVDGLRIVPLPYVPWDTPPTDTVWVVEGSLDGQNFSPLELTARAGIENAYSFPLQPYQAVRLTHAVVGSPYAPPTPQDIPALNGSSDVTLAEGVRDVEFLQQGLPLESTLPRAQVRPAQMWEYNVNADYPSVDIDADASEIRATAWGRWERGGVGYLNYGGAQWDSSFRPTSSPDPLVWTNLPAGSQPGQAFIIYPGVNEPLPSVRLARFRDGVDDYDYLYMLNAKQPDNPVLQQVRDTAPYRNVGSMLAARQTVGEALDQLYTIPGGRWILGGGAPRKAH